MVTMTIERSKAMVLEQIGRTRAELDEALAGLSERQLTTPGAGGWSVKDHLAHIAAWETSLVALFEGRDRAEAIGLPAGAPEDIDAENEAIRDQHAGRPLDEVRQLFEQSHSGVMAILEGLTDADLLKPYAHYQPAAAGPNVDQPVVNWVMGNTADHYREHLPAIRAAAEA
jgi:uncharacterized protein (TIGR03083 family)